MPSDDNNVVRPTEFQRTTTIGTDSGDGQGGGPGDTMNGERLTRIEGRLTSIETEQRIHFRWAIVLGIAMASLVLTAFGVIMLRIDRSEDKLSRIETSVSDLPGKVASSLNQINQTLFQAISASKQQPPQVILLPAPEQNPVAPKQPAPLPKP